MIDLVVPEWTLKKLRRIGEFSKGAGISKDKLVAVGLSAVRYGELYTLHNVKIKTINSLISSESAGNSKRIKPGDILFAGSGETIDDIGKSAVYTLNDECYAGSDIVILSPSKDDGLFLAYLLNSQVTRRKLRRLGQGQSVVHLYTRDLRELEVSLPNYPEQRRIVEILETWDRYLEKLGEKIDLKKEIKKGLMQQLITSKIRIPGFGSDWREIRLGEIGDTYAGLSGKTKDDFGSGKPFITYMNIYTNPTVDQVSFELVRLGTNESQNMVKYGDILFTTSSETPEEVGIASVYLGNNNELYLNSFCFGYRLKDFTKLSPQFARHYFRGQQFRKMMTRIAQGASRYNLSKKYFNETMVRVPADIAEQERIAELLDNINSDIKLLNSKKRLALRQRMYLVNNLVTGKIRTPDDLRTSAVKAQHA